MKKFLRDLSLAAMTAVFMWGCASAPNPAMQSARAAFERAKVMPGVLENAPVAMHEAENALRKAERAEDRDEMTHLAHLAEKRVEYAITVAEKEMAEKKRAELEEEKQKVLLDTRQQEIERARREADLKQKALEEKAREIERARKEAEDAQAKALKMKEEADSARKDAEARAIEAELARQKAENLEKQIAELQAKKTDRGLVLTLGDVLFATAKSDLMPGAMRTVDKLAEFLHQNPERNIVVEGHTDSVGGEAYNMDLSQRRADSVRMALLSRGIDNHRIITRGYGKNYPVASNASEAGRQQNRRVEIIILDEGVKGESIMRQ